MNDHAQEIEAIPESLAYYQEGANLVERHRLADEGVPHRAATAYQRNYSLLKIHGFLASRRPAMRTPWTCPETKIGVSKLIRPSRSPAWG